MAITRLAQMGFESNTTGSINEWSGVAANAPTISNTVAKTGTYSTRFDNSTTQSAYRNIAGTRQLRTSFHWYSVGPALAGDVATIYAIADAGGNLLLEIRGDENNNLLLYVAGVLQDTAVNARVDEVFFHIGCDCKIDSVAGWVNVYADGILILEFAGNTGNADAVAVHFGNKRAAADYWGGYQYLDDIYIDDTTGELAAAAVPDARFSYLMCETGAAEHNAWTGSDGNSVDNYALIDERPHTTDTDYILAASADLLNTVQLATMAIPVGMTIKAVIPTAYAKKTDGGVDTHIAMLMYGAATLVTGADQELPTSYLPMEERFVAKPGGGAWDQAALDALQVGVKSRGSF